ncbi:hypothetical protein [Gordonia alkaliphila]|uniref:Uncharacterized protein n=1 Tax=Gordonia alkaliphila TaxID=1053547 RepID=A0ABP8ZGI9_9ACTN
MKKIIVGVGAAALLLAGCSSTTSAPPRTSTTSTSAEQPSVPAPSTMTDETPEPTMEQPGLPQELDFDLEGDPCEGVASVDIDDKHYECVDGVFRS